MEELQAQLISIIKDVKGDSSVRKISSQAAPLTNTTSSPNRRAPSSGRSSSSKKAKEGDKCPLCGKGYVRKGPYGLFCSEYKNGCKYRGK